MRGKAPSKDPEMKWWKVVKTRDHGGHIHGARRAAGEIFQAHESAMAFELLEGVVEETADPNAKAKPAVKAEEKAA